MQIYIIVHKGLEHPQNLLSAGVLEAPPRTQREDSTNLSQAPSGSYTLSLSLFFFCFTLIYFTFILQCFTYIWKLPKSLLEEDRIYMKEQFLFYRMSSAILGNAFCSLNEMPMKELSEVTL